MPSVPWQLPQVFGTFSGYTADRESLFGKMVCAFPWQLVHGCSLESACTLLDRPVASSAWQLLHSTLTTCSGCGYSLMLMWQSPHFRLPWMLSANFFPSTVTLCPAASCKLWSLWHARQSVWAWSPLEPVACNSRTTPAARTPLRTYSFSRPASNSIENSLDPAASPILPSSFSWKEGFPRAFPACLSQNLPLQLELLLKSLFCWGSHL